MRREGEEDDYFCFECAYFGGYDMCRRWLQPLARKGWEKSCGRFAHWKEAEKNEESCVEA